MKKKVLIILVLLVTFSIGRAAYFENLPYTITQPDGKTINCFISGDEFFNWIHDQEGFTIIQFQDGYYYYAEQDGDLIKPSKYLVNSVNPATVGLIKWTKISLKEYQRRKDVMYAYKRGAKGSGLPENAPQTGTLNNLVFYIRFADDAEFTTTRQSYDDKFNLTSGVSLKSYYSEVSYNNLTISSTHYPACPMTTNLSFKDTHPRSYYQLYNATTNPTGYSTDAERTTREHTLLANAISYVNSNSPVPTSLNIDGDNDNIIDNICFIIKGNHDGWNDLLWAHSWALYSQTVYINGRRVYTYTFQPENQVAVTTICHEMFHALGAPDLYHYVNQGAISPAGTWDIMDNGAGHMLTYMKWKYSKNTWITSIPVVPGSGTYTLNPVTSASNNCYKIVSPYSSNEYFMVEYRNKSGTYESNVPGSGLIVYRIDTRVSGNSNGPPDEVYVYRPGGTKSSNGTPSIAFFSSTAGRTAINDATDPKSFLQDGSAGGLRISNITTAGATISFTVTLPDPPIAPSPFYISSIFQTNFTAKWGSSATATGYRLDVATDAGFTSFVPGYNNKDVGNVTSADVTGLTPKTKYYCRVKAYNAGGSGVPSEIVSVITLTIPSSIPANLMASSCNDLVTLKWRKSTGEDFTRYRIYSQKAKTALVMTDSTTNGISDTSRVIYGLTRGDTIFFRVSSVNYDGVESTLSNQSSATVKPGVIPRVKAKWGDVLICYNNGDSLTNFQWYKGGTAIAGETSQYFQTNKIAGSYSVTTVDLNGCKNSSKSTLMPLPASGVKSLTVYPNPSSVNVTLKIYGEAEGKTVIRIFNSRGIKVKELQTLKTDLELLKDIPVSNLPYGIYQVHVSVNEEDYYYSQIVVLK
jgi:M6 family metalloprotease-like protein